MSRKSAIAILGGMGPQASIYLYKFLIEKSANNFGAITNDDYPEIHLYSIPVPDFISDNKNREEALKMLKEEVKLANQGNISCISIACNTAHILLPQLQAVSSTSFISMIDETAEQASNDGVTKVGLLGTPSTIKYGLYQAALTKHGTSVVVPTSKQIKVLERIIRNVLEGRILNNDSKRLVLVADSLKKRGAQGIILGCTELPLVFPKKYSLPVYNCLEILAMALLKKYYKNP